MAGLAEALAARGRPVAYIAERAISVERATQGWEAPVLIDVHVRFAPDAETMVKLVTQAPENSIHICQGFRGNGLIGIARRALAKRGLCQWVTMEMVDDAGLQGAVRRLAYHHLLVWQRKKIDGVLTIGDTTSGWLAARGMPATRIFPFAYFLPDRPRSTTSRFNPDAKFRFIYVGQLIKRKRVDMLLDALSRLENKAFELVIVGSGSMEAALQINAGRKLPGRVYWLGNRPIAEIPAHLAEADCLVLPSSHDGWGAVVSEALMAGTPAICSDACGASIAIRASGSGGVFPVDSEAALSDLLRRALDRGRQSPHLRANLSTWAQNLGATVGAAYLDAILSYVSGQKPPPPWEAADRNYLLDAAH
jgi:glycosyltransferase involved in cell wall biosynthesis